MAITRVTTRGEAPKEKTFFIPNSSINSIELILEKSWWKSILTSAKPLLVIRCTINGEEKEVVIETDKGASAIVQALNSTEQPLQPDNS